MDEKDSSSNLLLRTLFLLSAAAAEDEIVESWFETLVVNIVDGFWLEANKLPNDNTF